MPSLQLVPPAVGVDFVMPDSLLQHAVTSLQQWQPPPTRNISPQVRVNVTELMTILV